MLIGLALLFSSPNTFAQERNFGLSASAKAGFLGAHRKTMAHLTKQHSYGADFNVVLLTNGSKKWHHDFLFPEFNFEASYLSLGNKEVLGHAIGLGAGIYLPFFRKNGYSFGPHLNSALGYVSKVYDVDKNPKNNAISTNLNVFVSVDFRLEKRIKQHAFGFALGASHFSNGGRKLPNLGINYLLAKLHYTYYLQPIEFVENTSDEQFGQALKTWEFFTQLNLSSNQTPPTASNNYGVASIVNYFHYRFSNKFILESGLDLVYSQALIKQVEGDKSRWNNLRVGAYAAYVLPIHRFELMLGMGVYAFNPLNIHGLLFHKFGTRFQIYKFIWGNVSIKTHWFKAEYFEYGISLRW